PPSAFSVLACRNSIRRIALASISHAPQSSMPGGELTCVEENVNASEPASYVPTWYTATMVPASARPPLTYDLDVDVCVVGAGLAGLTTGRQIDRHRRRAQADRHAIRARARRPYRARLQHPSRLAGAAHRRHAAADLELYDDHSAARAAACRCHRLSRRGDRYQPRE